MAKYTKEQYAEVAPYVMGIGDFSASAIENKIEAIPEPPEPQPLPEPTKATIVGLFNYLFTNFSSADKAIEVVGGLAAVAHNNKMTVDQCRRCIADFEAMRALYNTPATEE